MLHFLGKHDSLEKCFIHTEHTEYTMTRTILTYGFIPLVLTRITDTEWLMFEQKA